LLIGLMLVLVLAIGAALRWIFHLSSSQRGAALQVGGLLAPLAVAVMTMLLGQLLGARRRADPPPADTLADLLAQAVRGQWRKEAVQRVLLTPDPISVSWSLSDLLVAGPVEAAVGHPDVAPAFPPLPGQTRVTEEQVRSGGGRGELFAMYAGIASGRVVVVGEPGTGKSGAAVLLLLDALDHRDRVDDKDRVRVPVPVLMTAHGWDPTTYSVQDWLAARLVADYPLFQHRDGPAEAHKLIDAGAVALLLDGLDEMDVAWRSAVLQALSDAPFRVVVLIRSHEMIQAAGAAWLVGALAVQLHYVSGPQAADYLERARTGPPPLGWKQLLTHLKHPDSALTWALSTPLAITLVRDTYQSGDDVSELLDGTRFSTADDIEQHLITRALPAAYTSRPGRPKPRYSQTQAQQALAFLAREMSQDHTRDLAWWRIPQWVPTRPRILASMVAGGLLGLLLGALAYWPMAIVPAAYGDRLSMGLGDFLLRGLAFGLGVGLPLGLAYGRGGREPNRVGNWRAISLRSVLTVGVAYGILLALASRLAGGLLRVLVGDLNVIPHQLVQPMAELVGGLVAGFLLGLMRDPPGGLGDDQGGSQELVKSRRKNRVAGLVAAVTVGLVFGLKLGHKAGLVFGLVVAVTFGLAAGLVFWLTQLVAGFAVGSAHGESSPQGPLESWRNHRVVGLVAGLVFGLGLGLGFGAGNATVTGLKLGFRVGFVAGLVYVIVGWLVLGVVYATTSSVRWSTTLAWLQLQRSHRVPAVDLMSFLEDARHRDILRTVGAVYQFRNATLQDQLAGQTTASPATFSAA